MSKNIKAKKHLGQNFLQDKNIITKILDIAKVDNSEIVEIGPGQGALTEQMVLRAKSVLAFEIDSDMIPILENKIQNDKFNLLHQDFLKSDLNWEGKRKVVANLPYYITSKILFKIFENIEKFSSLTIMVQEEVADRMVAKVNKKEYGKLSISSQYFSTIKKELRIPPQAFIPIPKVNSAVITLDFDKTIDLDSKSFLLFIRKSFAMKRKTLNNNWKNFLTSEKINAIFENLKINPNSRPQELTLDQYKQAFKMIDTNNLK